MENEYEEVEETSTDDVETSENNEEQNPENELKTLKAQKEHWKKKYNELKEKPEPVKQEINKVKKTDRPDYGEIAFLEQRKVTHPDDQMAVKAEAERLKLPLTDVLGMEHMQKRLADSKAQRSAENAIPKGRGDNSSKTKSDVDYWLKKGETPDDQELAEKVINARMKKERSDNTFSDELYTG